MKIKSIPDDPTITLSALKVSVNIYEEIEAKVDENKTPTDIAYNLGRMAVFELFFKLMGVQFETGDQA